MSPSDLTNITLENLICECEREALQSRIQEKGFCFELFRRALNETDAAAQEALVKQYTRLIQKWVTGYQPNLGEEFDDVVQDIWCKYWNYLVKKTQPRVSGQFTHVGEYLKYLKLCVRSVTLDHQRKVISRERRIWVEFSEVTEIYLPTADRVETPEEHLDRMTHEETVRLIRERCEALLKEPRERRIFELLYDRGLKPKEVVTEHADEFPDLAEVQKLEERIVKRLRRVFLA
jgi:RNA polymerase sigma factor (sigma-70 family)